VNDVTRRDGLQLALECLEGLSVGDAMGERFFGMPDAVMPLIDRRDVPPGRWRWTDDTLMAASVVEVLARSGTLHPDRLAASFAERYDSRRGYGPQTSWLLMAIRHGMDRHEIVAEAFDGAGSFGNGSAMRAGPEGIPLQWLAAREPLPSWLPAAE
jgi:ADP-ribosylglycohydrolase